MDLLIPANESKSELYFRKNTKGIILCISATDGELHQMRRSEMHTARRYIVSLNPRYRLRRRLQLDYPYTIDDFDVGTEGFR